MSNTQKTPQTESTNSFATASIVAGIFGVLYFILGLVGNTQAPPFAMFIMGVAAGYIVYYLRYFLVLLVGFAGAKMIVENHTKKD
jgi:asparagine N-glycosylation enzyme membrane subunit Stt3